MIFQIINYPNRFGPFEEYQFGCSKYGTRICECHIENFSYWNRILRNLESLVHFYSLWKHIASFLFYYWYSPTGFMVSNNWPYSFRLMSTTDMTKNEIEKKKPKRVLKGYTLCTSVRFRFIRFLIHWFKFFLFFVGWIVVVAIEMSAFVDWINCLWKE